MPKSSWNPRTGFHQTDAGRRKHLYPYLFLIPLCNMRPMSVCSIDRVLAGEPCNAFRYQTLAVKRQMLLGTGARKRFQATMKAQAHPGGVEEERWNFLLWC